MKNKTQIDYKQILEELKKLEPYEYPISPSLTNSFRALSDYDAKSGLIGACHILGTLAWQMRMAFDFLWRPFVDAHWQIKTDRDRAVLTLFHLVLKHIKQFVSDYEEQVVKILNLKEIKNDK